MSMQTIKTAVIPMAGLGKRLYPITKIIPKQLLPILNKPLLEYILLELMQAKIKKIICVINPLDRLTKQYISSVFIPTFIKSRKNFRRHFDVRYIKQNQPCGLADAILVTKKIIGQKPFVVILPDIIFDINKSNELASMLAQFYKKRGHWIGIATLDKKEISNYGIVQCTHDDARVIARIIEKPSKKLAFSNLGIIGRYIFMPKIFDSIQSLKCNHRDEKSLTDAINQSLLHKRVYAYLYKIPHYDCGRIEGYLRAILYMASQKPILRKIIKNFQK